jgi:hypothetical protein
MTAPPAASSFRRLSEAMLILDAEKLAADAVMAA